MARKKSVPKKVAGVPVPEAMRNSGYVKALLASPLGKKVLADAMLAAAGAAAAVLIRRQQQRRDAKPADLSREVLRAAAGAVTVGLGRAALRQLAPEEARAASGSGRKTKATARKAGRKTARKAARKAAPRTAAKKRAAARKSKTAAS